MHLSLTWDTLRQTLEARRQALAGQIGAYPPPIPACDAQFNHLLEQRRQVSAELKRLDEAAAGGTDIREFVASSPFAADDGELAAPLAD